MMSDAHTAPIVEPNDEQCYRDPISGTTTDPVHTKEDIVLTTPAEAATQSAAQAAAKATPKNSDQTPSDALLDRILSSLDEDKAEDVVAIDLRGKSEMADHMVICSGRSTRQVAAISDKLTERLKAELGILSKSEGKDAGDWVLIDAGDVIVHVFRPEVREFYQLEKMWQPAAATGPAPKV